MLYLVDQRWGYVLEPIVCLKEAITIRNTMRQGEEQVSYPSSLRNTLTHSMALLISIFVSSKPLWKHMSSVLKYMFVKLIKLNFQIFKNHTWITRMFGWVYFFVKDFPKAMVWVKEVLVSRSFGVSKEKKEK